MSHSSWHYRKKLKLAICIFIVISSGEPTLAQSIIVPDNTLGSESSRVITNVNSLTQEIITGGAQRGVNLFHSFREFNVGEGSAVYFSNPGGIENILGRVTGNSRSEILGKLGVLGNGNLFLINPNGIIFGAGASLDVSGSFVATSANAIKFGEQGFFSASSPETPSLLTIKPSALFFNQIGAGSIENNSIASSGVDAVNNPVFGLRVGDRQSLLLVGGNVLNAGGLNALGGRVELGSVASSGEVGLNVNNQNPALTFPNQVVRGDISLTNGAFVDVAADSGGAIALYANNINLSGGSFLNAGIVAGLGTPETIAGDINLNATQAISISQSSSVTNQVSEDAKGNSGNINIQAGSLNLTEGSELASRTLGEGNSGNIFVDVSGAVILDGLGSDGLPSRIINSVRPLAIGNGGNINLKAQSLTLKAGVLSSNTFGRGNTGNILVDVSGAVTLDDPSSVGLSSRIVNQVLSPAVGNGGDINIKAESLTVKQGSFLNASISGKGNSGNILIDVKGAVTFEGEGTEFFSGIGNQVLSLGVGNSGDINIKAESLILGQGNDLNASTLGRGNGGNILIDVKGAVTINADAGIFSVVRSSGIGNGGDINLKADSLTIRQSGALNTFTLGRGNAGNISVDVKGAVIIDGNNTDFNTGIATIVTDLAIGNGGDINLKAGSLTLTQGGLLSAGTDGRGNAGNIFVDVKGAVSLDGIDSRGFSSGISSQVAPSAIGNGGDINLKADSLTIRQGGFLSTTTFGEGNAGNISVDVKGAISLDGENSNDSSSSQISTEVASLAIGDSGNINLKADSLTLTQGGFLNARTRGRGNAGNVSVDVSGAVTIDGMGSSNFSGITSQVEESGIGDGGDINIKAESLTLKQDSGVITNTFGQGNGGNIGINLMMPNSRLTLSDEAAIAASTSGQGKGGNIQIEVFDSVNLTNNSEISVNSQGQGDAGDLRITTGFLTLQERSRLLADTFSSEGGNIQLQVSDILLLRNNSRISTSAGQEGAGGNGGNIDINTKFLLAVPSENSDITANAFAGKGGLIKITTQGIFGIKKQDSQTTLSDITAFSQQSPQLDGEIVIDIQNADISSELVALPTNVVDVSRLIAQRCSVRRVATNQPESEFIITGRGGLPPQPTDALRVPAIAFSANTIETQQQDSSPQITSTLEANSWKFDEQGRVILIASASYEASSLGTKHGNCRGNS